VRRALLAIGLAASALLGAGCGDGSGAATVGSPAQAEINGETPAELKEAHEVQDYFVRNCAPPGTIQKVSEEDRHSRYFRAYKHLLTGAEAMCGRMASITVEGMRVTIRSDIGPGARKAAGAAFCNLIQGSDVADFTPGHELQALDGTTIKVCPARSD
jgi:hypothetical protein